MATTIARGCARLGRSLSPFLLRRAHANFSWSVLWQITGMCNGRCRYCALFRRDSHPDVMKVFRKIKGLAPKDIVIFGGEPYLYPGIVPLLKAIREEMRGPYATISTNLAVDMAVVKESLPFLDQIQASIDGMGAVNALLRGYDGDLIAGRIREVYEHIRREGLRTKLFTHSVVTRDSLPGIEQLVSGIQGYAPGICMGFSLVEPYSHPLSIAGDSERMKFFLSTMIRLKKRFPVNICDRLAPPSEGGIPPSSNIESAYEEGYQVVHTVKCRRQYFLVFVSPAGEVQHCNPHIFYHQYRSRIKNLVERGSYLSAARMAFRMIDQIVLRPYSPLCHFPCKCERFIEDLLESGHRRATTPEIARLARKFSRDELARAQAFLAAQFNEPLSPGVEECLRSGEAMPLDECAARASHELPAPHDPHGA